MWHRWCELEKKQRTSIMAGMNTQFFELNAFDWISIDILLSCNVGHQKRICSLSQQQLLKLFWQEAISCMQNVPLRGHQWTIFGGIRTSFCQIQKRPCTMQYFKWIDLSRKRDGDLINICTLTRTLTQFSPELEKKQLTSIMAGMNTQFFELNAFD